MYPILEKAGRNKRMKRTIFKGGKMFALAAALLCSTAALGSTYAYADTAQDLSLIHI